MSDVGHGPLVISPVVVSGSNEAHADICEKVCQFTCGGSVVFCKVYCIWVLSSTNKTGCHQITKELLSVAGNNKHNPL